MSVHRTKATRRYPKGGWEVRYRDSFKGTRRKTFATKQDALDFEASVRTDQRRGDWIDPRKAQTRLGEVAEDWYASKADLRPKTLAGYRDTLDRFILPSLGERPIGQITPSIVRSFLAGLPEHLSPTSKRAICVVLSPILRQAVQDGMLRTNPIEQVKLPKAARPKVTALKAEQVAALAEEVGPDYRTLIYFAAYSGMRAGEIAALRVKNLDLLRGRVTVAESLADVGGHLHFGPPKSGKTRSLSIPRFLVEMIAADLNSRSHEPNDFVFPGSAGGPFRHNNFMGRHFRPAVRRALPEDLHGFRFHDLRHTCASLLIAQGVHAKAISERLGHSGIAITMDLYGHLYDDHEEAIMDGLDTTFERAAAVPLPAPAEVVSLR